MRHDTVQSGFQMLRRNAEDRCNTFLRTADKFPADCAVTSQQTVSFTVSTMRISNSIINFFLFVYCEMERMQTS